MDNKNTATATTPTVLSPEDRALFNHLYKRGVELGRKFEPQDMAHDPKLAQAANRYVVTYTGTFEFILQLRQQIDMGSWLTVGQLKGAANTLMQEAKRKMEAKNAKANSNGNSPHPVVAPAATAPARGAELAGAGVHTDNNDVTKGLNVAHIKDGRYRVLPTDISIKLDHPRWDDDPTPDQTRRISTLIAADTWLGLAKVRPDGTVQWWAKAAQHLKVKEALVRLAIFTADEQVDCGIAYAMVGKECFICGRALDTAESISAGYGPTCADKWGLPWGFVLTPDRPMPSQAAPAPTTKPEAAQPTDYDMDENDADQWDDTEDDGAPPTTPAVQAAKKIGGRSYEEIFGEDPAF